MAPGMVIALGHPDRGDDGVGPALLSRLQGRVPAEVVLQHAVGDALALLDLWGGAAWAIVLDAARSGAQAGTLHRVEPADGVLPNGLGRVSTHGFGLQEALALGATLGRMPGRLVIYAVEGAAFGAGAGLSPPVAAALDGAARAVQREIALLGGD